MKGNIKMTRNYQNLHKRGELSVKAQTLPLSRYTGRGHVRHAENLKSG